MKPQSHEQPSLPGLPKGATQQPKRNRFAKRWTPDEVQFAEKMIAHWSQIFGGVAGGSKANRTRHNRFVAIKFYRWNQEQPPEERFSDGAVRSAIEGYRDDPTMRKMVEGGRTHYKSFATWFGGDVADSIDRQLARLGIPRTLRGADAQSAKNRQAAEALLENSGLKRVATHATAINSELFEHIAWLRKSATQSKWRDSQGVAAFYGYLAQRAAQFEAEPPTTQADYRKRGGVGFRAIAGRSPKRDSLEDGNLVNAIALALFDQKKQTENTSCA